MVDHGNSSYVTPITWRGLCSVPAVLSSPQKERHRDFSPSGSAPVPSAVVWVQVSRTRPPEMRPVAGDGTRQPLLTVTEHHLDREEDQMVALRRNSQKGLT